VVETPRQPTPPLPTAEHAPHHSFEPQPPPSHSTQESTSVENIPVTTEQPLVPVTVPAETPASVEPSPAIETPSIPVEHPTIAPSEPVVEEPSVKPEPVAEKKEDEVSQPTISEPVHAPEETLPTTTVTTAQPEEEKPQQPEIGQTSDSQAPTTEA
jgi:hypothetical protein